MFVVLLFFFSRIFSIDTAPGRRRSQLVRILYLPSILGVDSCRFENKFFNRTTEVKNRAFAVSRCTMCFSDRYIILKIEKKIYGKTITNWPLANLSATKRWSVSAVYHSYLSFYHFFFFRFFVRLVWFLDSLSRYECKNIIFKRPHWPCFPLKKLYRRQYQNLKKKIKK